MNYGLVTEGEDDNMSDFYFYEDEIMNCHHVLDERPNPSVFTMHNHMRYEIYYFISGKGHFYIEGSEYPLHRGDLLIMRDTEAHYISLDKDMPYERLAMHFNPEFVRTFDASGALLAAFENREAGRANLFRGTDFQNDTYIRLLENMLNTEEESRGLQLKSNLIALLNEIRIAHERGAEHPGPGKETLAFSIISYINVHLFESLSLDEICSLFFISKAQLCRIFKKTTGTTVWGYITAKRLMAAQSMLAGGTPATEVYSRCGFNDYSVFFRAYRKQFGCTPGSVRAENR